MARPRKPTAVLKFTGRFDGHPAKLAARSLEPGQRARLAEEPPADLPAELHDVWRKLVAVAPLDVLADCDEYAVVAACILISRLYNMSITTAELAQLRIYLGEFGMTPAARSRVMPIAFGPPPLAEPGQKTGNAFKDV